MNGDSFMWSMVASLAGLSVIIVVLLVGAAARGTVALTATRHRVTSHRHPSAASASAAPGRVVRRAVMAAAVALFGVVAYAVGGVVAVGLSGVAAVAAGHRRRRRRAAVRQQAIEAALPDAIELLVLCIHAGRSPTQAVAELAIRAPPPVIPGFAAVELQLHRGRGLADALGELPAILGPSARDLATVMATADREGLPLVPILDRLAGDARAARRRQGEAAARRLPVRLSFPLVACTLPAFVLLAIAPAVLGALSTLRGNVP